MPIRALILTGGKHHDWSAASMIFTSALKSAGIESQHESNPGALASLASGNFQVVVLYTQGDFLDAPAVESLTKFVRNGGGLVAIHSANASITNDNLAKLIGSRFRGHGPRFEFTVKVSDPDHPIAHRIQPFRADDELYTLEKLTDFQPFLTTWADNKPLTLGYSKTEGKGRVVYLSNGHNVSTLSNPTFLQLFTRSVRYAAGEDWSNKTVKVAAIGYGGAFNMGKTHLESCNRARMKATAVCDLDPKRTATAKSELGEHVQTYNKVEDLLSKSDAEMCIVITPHNTHAPLAVQVLNSGRHVVTEKPFTINVPEATQIIDSARKNQKMATVFHNRRWDGDFMTIRDLVRSGAIGDVFKIECFMGSYGEPKSDWWRASKEITGGALHDWGAHFIDWILQLMPHKIESISGFFQKRMWHQASIEDHAEATVRFEGARLAHIEFSAMAAVGKQRFRILGTHGAIEQKGWDAKEGIKLISYKNGTKFEGIVPCQKDDWDGFYRNVADHLLVGEPLMVTAEQARKVIAVISLSEGSSKQGGAPIPLPFEQ
jgi:scyllo-inositol 2-dehydrogenase (NADP+)